MDFEAFANRLGGSVQGPQKAQRRRSISFRRLFCVKGYAFHDNIIDRQVRVLCEVGQLGNGVTNGSARSCSSFTFVRGKDVGEGGANIILRLFGHE